MQIHKKPYQGPKFDKAELILARMSYDLYNNEVTRTAREQLLKEDLLKFLAGEIRALEIKLNLVT